MSISPICRKRRKAGFSLIELLLVTALLPIVFYTVYSNFSVGMRVWKTVNMPTPIEDLEIFYHKMGVDLHNTYLHQTILFEGEPTEVSFPSIVPTTPALGGENGIGQVRFYYDPSLKAVMRQVRDFSEVYKESEGKRALLMKDVSSFEINYYVYDETDKSYAWTDSWKPHPKKLPVAVRIQFSVGGSGAMNKTYFLPTGG